MEDEGRPDKLIMSVAEKILNEYIGYMNVAKKDAHSLLESGYKDIIKKMEVELQALYSKHEELLKSYESTKELELKMALQEEKTRFVEEVLNKCWEKIYNMPPETKEKVYTYMISKLVESTGSKKGILHIEDRDTKVIEKAIKDALKQEKHHYKIISDLKSKSGGFIYTSEDGSMNYDFTLIRAFELMKPKLMSVAYKKLFEE